MRTIYLMGVAENTRRGKLKYTGYTYFEELEIVKELEKEILSCQGPDIEKIYFTPEEVKEDIYSFNDCNKNFFNLDEEAKAKEVERQYQKYYADEWERVKIVEMQFKSRDK